MYRELLLVSTYYILTGALLDALLTLALSLGFDLFDQRVSWDKRPVWQKGRLMIQLLGLAILGFV